MPYNRNLASKRLENLKKKLSKDQLLAKRYSETLNSYISKGYAPKIESTQGSQRNNITNYIRHHGVINQHKPNKWRVVFDATAKYKGHNLNDYFLVGPDLLNNLVSTIIRFRLGKYAVSGDIEQMFHQISVSPKDRDSLRFLWRENSNEVVSDYKMIVHLFGKNDSPCVANFALKRAGADKKDITHPSVVTSIDQDFYMDDFLKSDDSEEHLTRITKTVISVLKESGFRLTKFRNTEINNRNIKQESYSRTKWSRVNS